MKMISKEEREEIMRHYMRQAEDYDFAVAPSGAPCFLLKNSSGIIPNSDGSVTWFARAISLDAHTFIELTTGEGKTKTIYIPICLVNAKSRHIAETLLNTTVDPRDGRFGSRSAEVVILTHDGKGVVIRFELRVLGLSYVSLVRARLFSQDYMSQLKSTHCLFCKMVSP